MLAIFIFGVLGVFICLFVPPLLWLAFIGITIKLDFMGDLVKDCAKVLEIKREDAPEDVLKGKDPLSFHSWMTIEVLSYIVIGSFTIPFRKSMQVIKLMTLVYLRILAVAVAFCVLAVLALIAFCVALTVWVVSLPVTAPTTILFVTGLFAWKFFYYTHTKLVRIVVVDGLAGALLVHAAMSLLFGPLYAEFGPLARLGVCTLGAALCPALVYLNIQLVARRILKREPVL
jgi:hypothetical protein